MPTYLTTAEVAAKHGVTPALVRWWAKRGYLPIHAPGGPGRSALFTAADAAKAARRKVSHKGRPRGSATTNSTILRNGLADTSPVE